MIFGDDGPCETVDADGNPRKQEEGRETGDRTDCGTVEGREGVGEGGAREGGIGASGTDTDSRDDSRKPETRQEERR